MIADGTIVGKPKTSELGSKCLTLNQRIQQLMAMPIAPIIAIGALWMAAFFNLVDLGTDKDVVAVDFQVLVKLGVLAICGIMGGIGVLTNQRVRRVLFSFPVVWVVILAGFFLLAVPGSATKDESLVSAVALICVLLATVTALVQFGSRTVLQIVFQAATSFVVASWLAYFFWPALGVYSEPLANGEFAIRMAGLAHPNTLGQFSGITIVVGALLYSRFGLRSVWMKIAIGLAAAALIASLSRTSLMATMVALMVLYRKELFQFKFVVAAAWLAFVGLLGLTVFSLDADLGSAIVGKMSLLSKSGDAEELTSATGRAEIWSYAIGLVRDRPLTGYGAATSKIHLADYSMYTHNMILHVAFSTGVFGGLAALLMSLGRIRAMFASPHPVADCLVVFILVIGMFENVVFSFLAGLPTIILVIGLSLPCLDANPDDERDKESESRGRNIEGGDVLNLGGRS